MTRVNRLRAAAASFLLVLGFAPLAAGQEAPAPGVSVAGWAPRPGERTAWRVEQESGWRTVGGVADLVREFRVAVVQHSTVLGATTEGYSLLWEAGQPETATDFDRMFSTLLSLYGVRQLAFGTDRAGLPQRIYGVEHMRQRLTDYVAARRAEGASEAGEIATLLSMLEAGGDNPLYEAGALTPAAVLIGRLQRAGSWTAKPGDSFALRQADYVHGVAVAGDAKMTVDGVDPDRRSVTVSWMWEHPLEALPSWLQTQMKENAADGRRAAEALPGPVRAEAGSSASFYAGRARISIDDGSILSVEETRTLRLGLKAYVTIVKAERQ